jgi:diaminopropionate ammonia-lyase
MRRLALDKASRVLLIGTEGATDPAIYKKIVGKTPEEIAA